MFSGLFAGAFWGLDTVILGLALSRGLFAFYSNTYTSFILAPLVSTFLHDAASAGWMFVYMGARGKLRETFRALKSKGGRLILLGALLGGPIGMSGYVAAINLIGPAYTSIISSLFPALGALFSYLFLKERLTLPQIAGLIVSIAGVICLGYSADTAHMVSAPLGFLCAAVCCVSWALEAVICAYAMKRATISHDQALLIRQTTSAVFYGAVLLPAVNGWWLCKAVLPTGTALYILIAALFGTASYLCYYRAIGRVGASKAMALDITYSAWAVAFAALLLGTLPDVKSVVCGALVVLGSLLAATDLLRAPARAK